MSPAPTGPDRLPSRRSRPLRAQIALTALVATLAACGGNSHAASAIASQAATAEPKSQAAGYAATPTASATAPVTAAAWRDFGRWLASRAADGQFSGAALVSRGNHVLLDAGYGWADRAAGIPNTAGASFCVASIGKLFTAIAAAQLVQAHKLSFGDTLGRYLTGFTGPASDHVTIADLLDMTAGLGDVALAGPRPPATLAGQLKLIAKERLQFAPGSRFRYSNDDYIVLGAIIERVTHQDYASYIQAHVLGPAGMNHTRLQPYIPADSTGMAHGYAAASAAGTAMKDVSGQLQLANPSGGAAATAGDLLRFAHALLNHTLLSPAMTATVLTPRVNASQPGGPSVDKYTYGFAYQAINGVTFVGHNGGAPGYEAQLDVYPATGYVVVILTNQDRALVPAIQRSEKILTGSRG